MAQHEVVFQSWINSELDLLDYNILDLEFSAATQTLYASTGASGGISAYKITSTGAVLSDTAFYSTSSLLSGSSLLHSFDASGAPDILIQSGGSAGLGLFELADTGHIIASGTSVSPALTSQITLSASALLADNSQLLITMDAQGRLQGWQMKSNLRLQDVTGTDLSHDGSAHSATVTAMAVCNEDILVLADRDLGGLVSYRISSSSGALTQADVFGTAQGLAVAEPTALETITAHGQDWAILGSAGSSSVTVFRIATDGTLDMVDHLSDTLASRFGQLSALEVVTVEDRVLVLAAGADTGLSILELLPDGRLIETGQYQGQFGDDLGTITALSATMLDGGAQLDIYASSQSGAGIARLTLDLGGISGSLPNGPDHNTKHTQDGDLLYGAKTLVGGAGDDILVARTAGSTLVGGAGADLFVLGPLKTPEDTIHHIGDFTPGTDYLDLSSFTGLRSIAGLSSRSYNPGIELSFEGTRIRITSRDQTPISLEDIWPLGLDRPHRWDLGETIYDGITYGQASNDQIDGTDSNDHIDGQGGNDRITGRVGNDTLRGGDGDDRVWGGDDADHLYGGYGNDTLWGGTQTDQLWGGNGEDVLYGGNDNDTLSGGFGQDQLIGGSGQDQLFGDAGTDTLKGGSGADLLQDFTGNGLLFGGAGADTLKSGAGSDQLNGGGGADFLSAGRGMDVLFGKGGQDRLIGGLGNDQALGGGGDDLLKGGGGGDLLVGNGGHDTLKGGAGIDQLSGSRGADILIGGSGADVFVFSKVHGQDTVRDFTPGLDKIDLSALKYTFSDLQLTRQQGNVRIDTGEDEILLIGLHPNDLTADDFII